MLERFLKNSVQGKIMDYIGRYIKCIYGMFMIERKRYYINDHDDEKKVSNFLLDDFETFICIW